MYTCINVIFKIKDNVHTFTYVNIFKMILICLPADMPQLAFTDRWYRYQLNCSFTYDCAHEPKSLTFVDLLGHKSRIALDFAPYVKCTQLSQLSMHTHTHIVWYCTSSLPFTTTNRSNSLRTNTYDIESMQEVPGHGIRCFTVLRTLRRYIVIFNISW